jgi:hypothetical protein
MLEPLVYPLACELLLILLLLVMGKLFALWLKVGISGWVNKPTSCRFGVEEDFGPKLDICWLFGGGGVLGS